MREAPLLIDGDLFYCPLCQGRIVLSAYLSRTFRDRPRALWLANMVTHYRHEHVVYYNHSVGYHSWRGRYHDFKHEVNERAKRQILRKARGFMRVHGFRADDLDELEGTTPETRALALRLLGGSPAPSRPPAALLDCAPVEAPLVTLARDSEQLRLDRFLVGVGQ